MSVFMIVLAAAVAVWGAYSAVSRLMRLTRSPFLAPTISRMFLRPGGSSVPDEEFYPFIRLPNGTFKTTKANRMQDVDEKLITLLSQEQRHFEVLDVATSSGTCALELYDSGVRKGLSISMFASDLTLHASCLTLWPARILFCEKDYILQVDIAGLAFPRFSDHAGRLFSAASGLVRLGRRIGWPMTTVSLLSGAAARSSIIFSNGDVLGDVYQADPARQFDVIRAANLLQTSYFTEDEIRLAVVKLKCRLRSEGLLVLVRSDQNLNLASFFRLHNDVLELVEQINGGVEVAPWIAIPHG